MESVDQTVSKLYINWRMKQLANMLVGRSKEEVELESLIDTFFSKSSQGI